jgi:cytochrome c biogenesis protein CcdA
VLLILLVLSIAAVDSLNPSTLLPALLYAVGRNGLRDVAAFTAGIFAVSTAGGLILVFGPGRALLHFVSQPRPHLLHVLEAAAGVALLAAAAFLWRTRAKVGNRLADQRPRAGGGSALLVGAGIMATELPTAIPYFGALIAVSEGAHGALADVALVLAYNLVFVAPLLALVALLALSGDRGALVAQRLRVHLVRHAPIALPALVALLGLALLAVGLAGLLRG